MTISDKTYYHSRRTKRAIHIYCCELGSFDQQKRGTFFFHQISQQVSRSVRSSVLGEYVLGALTRVIIVSFKILDYLNTL